MPADISKLSAQERARYFAGNLITVGFLWLVLRLPYRWRVAFMGWFMSRIGAPLAGFRKRIRENLALTHPDMPRTEIHRLCRAVPDNVGRSLIEMYSAQELKARLRDTEIEGPGFAVFQRAQAEGRPVLLAPSHFGNYIAIRAKLQMMGYEAGGLYRRMANPYFNRHYVAALKQTGEVMFEQGATGMRLMVRHLRSGGIVGILHDLHVLDGTELTFFGHPAVTSTVMAELSLRYKAQIIPCYSIRQPNGLDFRLVMQAPIPASDPETMTQDLNDDLERMVRAHMEQWFWIHRRWKPSKRAVQPARGA